MASISPAGATLGLVVGSALGQVANMIYAGLFYGARLYFGIEDVEVVGILMMSFGALVGLASAAIVGPILYLRPTWQRLSRSVLLLIGIVLAGTGVMALTSEIMLDRRAFIIVALTGSVVAILVGVATTRIQQYRARRTEEFLRRSAGIRDDERYFDLDID